jgi:hypothetical protein
MNFNIFKFEKTFGGGIDNWYTKSKRWAKKQSPWLSHLITGVIEWLHKLWIDGKILQVMADVDKDIDKIKSTWEENDREITPHIVETGVFGDEGWSIEITNPIVERGTSATSTGMVTPSDAQRLQEDEGNQRTP